MIKIGKIWKAREVTVTFKASVTITTNAALDTFFGSGTDITADLKEVTLQEPGYSPEMVNELGEATSGHQNADWDEKTYEAATIKGTLVMRGDEQLEILVYGSGTAINSTHHRYRPGDGNGLTPAILVNFDDSTYEVNFAFDDAHVKLGERKMTSDGHAEYDFEATSLPGDFYGPEFKD